MVVVRDFAMSLRGSQDLKTDRTSTAGSVNLNEYVIQEGLEALSCKLLKKIKYKERRQISTPTPQPRILP